MKIAKRMKKYLDSHMLSGIGTNNNNPNLILEEPGMEMIFEDDSLPKEIIPVEIPEKEEKEKIVSFAPESEKKAKKKTRTRPVTQESVVDFRNLKDNENPEKLEYNYDQFELKIIVFLHNSFY